MGSRGPPARARRANHALGEPPSGGSPASRSFAGADHTSEDLTEAFWGACNGGRQATATSLLAAGAELNWIGWDHLTPLDAAERAEAGALAEWLRRRRARSADQV